jgi:hypothetical protein
MKAKRLLAGVAKLCDELCRADSSDDLFASLLDGAERHLVYKHTMIMLAEERGERLFTVATRGFSPSGVGSEQRIGEGLWGKVAERRAPLRIVNLGRELLYARTVREVAARAGDERLTREIALPGLAGVESVLAIPLLARGELLGVIGVESLARLAFDGDDEHALTVVSLAVANRLATLRTAEQADDTGSAPVADPAPAPSGTGRIVRYYRADDSIFIDHEYVIKGLPGRILWRLLCEHANGRTTFSNKELRVDPALELPVIRDNLESRLILLRTRLDEKACGIRLMKRGRGQFAIEVTSALELIDIS